MAEKTLQQEELERLTVEYDTLQMLKAGIEADTRNPKKYIEERLTSLQKRIDTLSDRKPTHPGNITMKQHLLAVKKRIEDDPRAEITRRLNDLTKYIEDTEKRMLEVVRAG